MTFKNIPLVNVKAGEDDGLKEGEFIAYASVFDNKDSYGDVVRKGAFTESLEEWDAKGNSIPVLYGHDFGDPFSNVGVVLEAKEDDHGLKVRGALDLDEPKAAKVYKLVKGRRLSQLSFAYDVLEGAMVTQQQAKAMGRKDADELGDYYELRKLKIYEVSLVPIGANQETEVLAVKHAAQVIGNSKAGRSISAENESTIREAITLLKSVLPEGKSASQESEASGEPGPSTPEGPAQGDPVPVPQKQASQNPSVDDLGIDLALAIRARL